MPSEYGRNLLIENLGALKGGERKKRKEGGGHKDVMKALSSSYMKAELHTDNGLVTRCLLCALSIITAPLQTTIDACYRLSNNHKYRCSIKLGL